VCPEKETKMFL